MNNAVGADGALTNISGAGVEDTGSVTVVRVASFKVSVASGAEAATFGATMVSGVVITGEVATGAEMIGETCCF